MESNNDKTCIHLSVWEVMISLLTKPPPPLRLLAFEENLEEDPLPVPVRVLIRFDAIANPTFLPDPAIALGPLAQREREKSPVLYFGHTIRSIR